MAGTAPRHPRWRKVTSPRRGAVAGRDESSPLTGRSRDRCPALLAQELERRVGRAEEIVRAVLESGGTRGP